MQFSSKSSRSTGASLTLFTAAALASEAVCARGVSPYIPLSVSPEIERKIERVLILADDPVLTRPIAAARVLAALPRACKQDADLCADVQSYLNAYMETIAVTNVGVETATGKDSTPPLPNRRGLKSDSGYEASVQSLWQPNDYILVNLGAISSSERTEATGSFLSIGTDYAQLDLGFRDHWFSPATDSSMLISTEAPTLPSVTLSNYAPLTSLRFRYELFAGELSKSDKILSQGVRTTGNPVLSGVHLSIAPADGWSLGVNRLLQFGGGGRGGRSFGDIFKAFVKPAQNDNVGNNGLTQNEEFGNQVASFTSRFIYPGRTPFAVYFEYAGEDTSKGSNFRLGNAALTAGIDFPELWGRANLTFEASEWQNGWYVNTLYGDGLTNERFVLGQHGADQRVFGDAVGAHSLLTRLGVDMPGGGLLDVSLRYLGNESYTQAITGVDYVPAYSGSVRYSYNYKDFLIGAEVTAGRDVFDESYTRFGAFLRYSGFSSRQGGRRAAYEAITDANSGAEIFLESGVNATRVEAAITPTLHTTSNGVSPHIGIGARRPVGESSDLGARLDLDSVEGNTFLGVRALDYRFRATQHLAFNGFLGASRYDLATPAYGYYLGLGTEWIDLFPRFNLGLEFRYGEKVARDRLSPSDVPDPKPDLFFDVLLATLKLTYRM